MMSLGQQYAELANALQCCDSVVIGAGAGLSTAAGLTYAGNRFEQYFGDFARKYPFRDMYAGGFYPYALLEENWAYWSRYIWINRYAPIPKNTYERLYELVKDKDYFVLTTNVDHCFQRVGFDKQRLFYTQGDYGLFQCRQPCCCETWDNYELVRAMVESQGFVIAPDEALLIPEGVIPKMTISSDLVPSCPRCGHSATMNLRADATFVEDAGWHEASKRYSDFIRSHATDGQRVLFLELGVGGNTPIIIKYPFWRLTASNSQAVYACINLHEAYVPHELQRQSICLDADIDEAFARLAKEVS